MSDVKVGRVEFGIPQRETLMERFFLGCRDCAVKDRRIAELEAEVAELRKRIDPCCGGCGSSDFYVDKRGTWCGNENCRRLIKPAAMERKA